MSLPPIGALCLAAGLASSATALASDGTLPGVQPVVLSPSIAQEFAFAGLALALDGETAVIGASSLDGQHSGEGGVDVLVRSGSEWVLQQHLPNPTPSAARWRCKGTPSRSALGSGAGCSRRARARSTSTSARPGRGPWRRR
jgi:hypothetical protein